MCSEFFQSNARSSAAVFETENRPRTFSHVIIAPKRNRARKASIVETSPKSMRFLKKELVDLLVLDGTRGRAGPFTHLNEKQNHLPK